MLTFSGLTFDLSAAINLALGGLIAVIGGLVAAQIQADATRRSAAFAATTQALVARESDFRVAKLARVEPLLGLAARLMKSYARAKKFAEQGKIDQAGFLMNDIESQIDEFDDISIYARTSDDFVQFVSAFMSTE